MGVFTISFAPHVAPGVAAGVLAELRKRKARRLAETPASAKPREVNAEKLGYDFHCFTGAPIAPPKCIHKKWTPPKVVSDRVYAARGKVAMFAAIAREVATKDRQRARSFDDVDYAAAELAAWHRAVLGEEEYRNRIRQDRADALAAALALAHALGGTVAPFHWDQPKRRTARMANALQYRDQHYSALHEVWEVAAHLVNGHGGPAKYRVSPTDGRCAMEGFAKTKLTVHVSDTPYLPVAAMCIAGFILYGFEFERHYTAIGITGDLAHAFQELVKRFGEPDPIAVDDRANGRGPALVSASDLRTALEGPHASGKLVTLTLAKPGAPALHGAVDHRTALSAPDRAALADLSGR